MKYTNIHLPNIQLKNNWFLKYRLHYSAGNIQSIKPNPNPTQYSTLKILIKYECHQNLEMPTVNISLTVDTILTGLCFSWTKGIMVLHGLKQMKACCSTECVLYTK